MGRLSGMVQGSPRRRLSVDARRAEILSSAIEIAREVGLIELTLLDVRQRAGVSAGLVNHYFTSLDGLRVAVFCEMFSPGTTDAGAPALEQLADLVASSISPASAAEARVWVDAMLLGRASPEMRSAVTRRMAEDRGEMAEVIRLGCDSGAFRSTDPERSATRILVTIDGYLMQFLLEDGIVRPELRQVVWDVAEAELALANGSLQRAASSA